MKNPHKGLLHDATRLTRSGDLLSATRTIREALGSLPSGAPAHAASRAVRDATNRATNRAAIRAAAGSNVNGFGTPTSVEVEPFTPRSADSISDGSVLRGRHEESSGSLDYRLYVPPPTQVTGPPALLVLLHGCTQDADDFARGTQMDTLARESGLLVLYPEQSSRSNPQRCWNWFQPDHQRRGSGEPRAIAALLETIVETHGVDPARVYVAGLSAGGAMAAILGALFPERFAAIGVHSGLAAGSANDLPSALAAMRGGAPRVVNGVGREPPAAAACPPTIVFHGDADRTVHPDNGERVFTTSLDSNPGGHIETRQGHKSGHDWTRRVRRDASGCPVAEHWLVHGAAHTWFGGDPRGSHTSDRGPIASREMLKFFLAQQ